METAPASSPVLTAQVNGFTPINYDNSFMVSVMTEPTIVMTSFATICYSPGLFVSSGSLSFILLSASLLIKVQTDIMAIVPLAVLASPYVIVTALVLSSPGFFSLV